MKISFMAGKKILKNNKGDFMAVDLPPLNIPAIPTIVDDGLTTRREEVPADDPGYDADDLGASSSSDGRRKKSYNFIVRQRIEQRREEAHKAYRERQRIIEAQFKALIRRKEQPMLIEID